MKTLRLVLSPFIVLVVVFGFFRFSFFSNLEHKAQDSLFRLRGPKNVSGEVVIVAIDKESENAFQVYPYPREYHAKLIENLNQAGARLIVFDVLFIDESGDPQADSLLAETAAKYGNVIFAGEINYFKDSGITQKKPPTTVIENLKIPWGIANKSLDRDNFIRRYTLYENYDETPYYSLGVSALLNGLDAKDEYQKTIVHKEKQFEIGPYKIPLYQKNRALINYYGPANTFRHIPYSQVLDDLETVLPGMEGAELGEYYDLLDAGVFKDKIVLVGASLESLHDLFFTPFDTRYTAGVEIHANFIEMVRMGDYLDAINYLFYLILLWIVLILLWYAFKSLKPQIGAAVLILICAAIYLVAYQLFSRAYLMIPIVQGIASIIIVYSICLVSHYLQTQKEKRFIRHTFQQYMAPELVNQLLNNPQSLKYGGSLQEITVLFSDIRSFTTYSENHSPEDTVLILKEYLTEMVNIILRNHGILDKFVGDEVMALFGTPVPMDNHAQLACKTALEMRESLNKLQEKWSAEGRESFEIGIGVNTGTAVVGNLGSEQIFDYTAIGDTINLGARLEAINKEYPTKKKIIISEFTLEKLGDQAEVRYIDEVKVKGKNKAVKIYELIDLR